MTVFDFIPADFAKLGRMDEETVLANYRGPRVVVCGLEIGGTPLTTLLAIAPHGTEFGQDWWLGQAYWDWYLTAGFNEALLKTILDSLKQSRLSLKRLPINFLSLSGGGIERERGSKTFLWEPRLFLSTTVPTDAVEETLKIFEESYSLISDYFSEASGNDYKPEAAPYGEVKIERAFSIGFHGVGYRHPMMQELAKHKVQIPRPAPIEQKKFLQETINDLEEISAQSISYRKELWRQAKRRQYFYLLDAKEFESDLTPMVVLVNTLRSRVLKLLDWPHFFSSVAIRLLDTSANKPQKKYQYLRNDRDWLLQLHKNFA